MDVYVIRIYRRDEKDSGKAAGQVEFVEQGRVVSFTCADELLEILGLKEKRAPGKRAERVSRFGNRINEGGRNHEVT